MDWDEAIAYSGSPKSRERQCSKVVSHRLHLESNRPEAGTTQEDVWLIELQMTRDLESAALDGVGILEYRGRGGYDDSIIMAAWENLKQACTSPNQVGQAEEIELHAGLA